MNLNEHAEAEKVFMKSQVVMLIARSREQRQIVCSMRKVAEFETVLTSETVELPEDEEEGQSGTSLEIQVNLLYVDRQLPAQKQLQLKTDFIALNLVVGQESVSETIWSVDVVDHKTSYNKLDIANMPYSEQELLI
jgi:anion-transporting  ArsA/GET3 family ATPase